MREAPPPTPSGAAFNKMEKNPTKVAQVLSRQKWGGRMGLKRSVPPFDPASRLLEISLSRASLRRLSRASIRLQAKKARRGRARLRPSPDEGSAPAGHPGGFRLFAPDRSEPSSAAGARHMGFGNAGRARGVFGCGRGRRLALTKKNDLSPRPTNAGNAFVSPTVETAASLNAFIERARERHNVGIVRRLSGCACLRMGMFGAFFCCFF